MHVPPNVQPVRPPRTVRVRRSHRAGGWAGRCVGARQLVLAVYMLLQDVVGALTVCLLGR